MHDLYLFRTFYGAYQTFVNGYYVSATAYDRYATTQEQAVQDLHTLDDSLFHRTEQTSSWRTNADHFRGNFNEGLAYGYMPLSSTVLHTIVISWPFITNVATVYTVS